MDMRLRRTKLSGKTVLRLSVGAAIVFMAAAFTRQHTYNKRALVAENLETGEVYASVPVEAGDEVSFEWEHSFEHIPWHEYYEVEEDGSFLLHTISVAGFGAGIPAEMDCDYRYEDGLVYMENIESRFEQFNWINSHTALKEIALNGERILTGEDMPHHKKIVLSVKERKEAEQ